MKTRHLLLMAVASAVLGFASPGHAELYRCQRPNGSIVYTDTQATCPGATIHEPQAEIQSVTVKPTRAAGINTRKLKRMRRQLEAESAKAEEWKQKKTDAEQELAQVTTQKETIRRFVILCNRHGKVYRTKANGLREGVTCNSVRSEFAAIESRHSKLSAYLDGGLQQECHRAGCLPGWVR